MTMIFRKHEVHVNYVNWRGEKRWRRVQPIRLAFESSQWHPEEQWLMHAIDLETGQVRAFAMKDVQEWRAP